VAIFSFRPAFAQEPDLDPAMMCDAAAAAYQAYALNTRSRPAQHPEEGDRLQERR
jgi:hypothetical protein